MSWVAASRLLEAVHDDEALTDVVSILSGQLGARSFFGAFGLEGGLQGVVANNGWWDHAQLALYDREFLALDPCAAAMLANWRPQQVIDLEREIGSDNFERSRLYQDFIRPMGDDTFRALGLPFEGPAGKGAITFQRGIAQPRFGSDEVALLTHSATELAQIFILRARIAGMDQAVRERSAALDAVDEALLILRPDGLLVHANSRAESELRRGRLIRLERGRVRPVGRADFARFETMLAQAAAPGSPPGGGMHLVGPGPVSADVVAVRLLDGSVLLSVSNPVMPDVTARLRSIYGLSAGEADIAVRLWAGETVEQIALGRGTSRHTVRFQIRTICLKMDCSRQIEIVTRIAMLPRVGPNS